MLIGLLLSLVSGVLLFGSLFVDSSQIIVSNSVNDHAAIYHQLPRGRLSILPEEIVTAYHHIAVNEKQPFMLSLLSQKVADGRPSDILWLFQQSTMRQLIDGSVGHNRLLVLGTVVCHQNLIG